tara:strand:- start:1154 stop:2032 length:879 start_codon:yes stop_codon:yes gene_type:complete
MNYRNADSSGNDIHVITDVVSNADTAGWYYAFMTWGQWTKSQIFYNQNPPITAMDTHLKYASYVEDSEIKIDPTMVTGSKERFSWFINVSKMENCYHYQSSQNKNTVKGLTADNVEITEDIKPEPFKIGNYEVTQEMIDENPEAFQTVALNNDGRIHSGVYDMHPEVRRLANEIFDIYRPHCEEIVGRKFKKDYTNGYLNRNMFGDTVWTHADPFDYTLIVYLNPDSYDLRKWGGETLFFNDDITFCRGAVTPKGSTACLFKSEIPHKVTGVSWEAEFDRMAITYYLEFDNG